MLKKPSLLPTTKWWEYFLSGTHYFVGWVLFILVICPVLYLILDVPSYYARPELYIMFYFPYMLLTLTIFAWSLSSRNYRIIELINGIVLQALCFPVYMRASLLALLGFRGSFATTPKGKSLALPLFGLWPQIGLSLICFFAVVWGCLRIYYERHPIAALVVNIFWCLYHFAILSTVLYFNHPMENTSD